MDFSVGLIFVAVFLITYYVFARAKNLPPGPICLPIIGSMFFFQKFHKRRRDRVFHAAAKTYGSVMSVRIGTRLAIVLDGYDVIHEAFVKKAGVFSDRPFSKGIFQEALKDIPGKGVILHPYGDSWRMLRRFTLQALRDFGVGKTSIEEKIFVEVEAISKCLDDAEGTPVEMNPLMLSAIGNIIFGIIFGRRYDYDDPEFEQIRELSSITFTGQGFFAPSSFLPACIAKYLGNKKSDNYDARLQSMRRITDYLFSQIDEHEATFDPDNIRDFVDIYLQTRLDSESEHVTTSADGIVVVVASLHGLRHKPEPNKILSIATSEACATILEFIVYTVRVKARCATFYGRQNIGATWFEGSIVSMLLKGTMFRVIIDLFIAGSETSSTALDWSFLYMSEFPEVQRKCQKEIDEVVGQKLIEYADNVQLPYVAATVQEVLRYASIAPFAVVHCASKDTTLRGYNIPAGSLILANLHSSHFDVKYWDKPEDFDPQRFIDSSGKCVKREANIPFSEGPRVCLGESLAKAELFVILANLLQRFDFKRENDNVKQCLDPRLYHLTSAPKPYKLKVERRF